MLFESSTTPGLTIPAMGDQTTGRLFTDSAGGGSGTVTSVSVASANGFAGTVANATTTPAITISTSITGILSGNGTAISAATTTGSGAVVLATSPTFVTSIIDPLVIGGAAAGSSLTLQSTSGVGTTDAIIFDVGNNGATEGGRFAHSGNLLLGTTTDSSNGRIQLASGTTITAGVGFGTDTTLSRANAGELRQTSTGTASTLFFDTSGSVRSCFIGNATGVLQLGTLSGADVQLYAGNVLGITLSHTASLATFAGHLVVEGVTSTGATGTGKFVFDTSPALTTPTIGAALATTINKVIITAPATSATLTIANGKTLTVSNTLTLAGTDSTTMTFPSTSASIARTDAAQTFTGAQTFTNAVIYTNNAITAVSNAATAPVTTRLDSITNSSAAGLTITITTSGATDGQLKIIRIYDFSAVAEALTFVGTENSLVSAPTTSNGSTTLPLTIGLQFNGATSLWRVLAVA